MADMDQGAARPSGAGTKPRRRATWTIFAAVALGSTSLFAAFTAAPLVATELTGSRAASGTPGAAALLGTAVGSGALSVVMARRGRRSGLRLGYGLGVVGAGAAVTAIAGSTFALFLAAMVLIGMGHSANQLSRFAVADMHHGEARSSALSWIVWAGTIGAVLGPALLRAGDPIATALGLPTLAGALTFVFLFYLSASACVAVLRPDPTAIAVDDTAGAPRAYSRSPLGSMWRLQHVRIALVVMVVGQVAMILVMTITPVHIQEHGHGLVAVGAIMTSHFVGMFALAPAIGRFVGRRGPIAAIFIGLPVLGLGAGTAALSRPSSGGLLAASLLLVGLGWSFGFIAGSALLTHGLTYVERVRLQGGVDAIVWFTSAAASLSSGILLAVVGFGALCLVGAAVVAVPMALVARRRAMVESSLREATISSP
jgi:MFS family permease